MSLPYYASFSGVTISAAQDLFNVAATSSVGFELAEFTICPDNVTTSAEVRLSIKRMTATVTNGSGGSAITWVKQNTSNTAAVLTGRMNDTTRATTTGSTTVFASVGMQLLNGYQFLPPPEHRPQLVASENLIIGLETAPASSTWSGYIVVYQGTF